MSQEIANIEAALSGVLGGKVTLLGLSGERSYDKIGSLVTIQLHLDPAPLLPRPLS